MRYAVLLWLAAWSGSAIAAADLPAVPEMAGATVEPAPEVLGSGVVEAVEAASKTLIIEGYRYRLASGVRVEQQGTVLDIAMLVPGTKVQFRYLRHAQRLPEIIVIRVVPDGFEIYRQ